MEETKECPFCAELIKAKAIICKHCHSRIDENQIKKKGRLVRVRVKAGDKLYWGDVFIPEDLKRASDVFNDDRRFFLLINTKEETPSSEIHIGFLALNKNFVEWIRTIEEDGKDKSAELISYEIYNLG